MGKGNNVRDFVAIVPLQRHYIELYAQPCRLRRRDAAKNGFKIAAARDAAIDIRSQAVARDVDPPDAGGDQIRHRAFQQRAVGGQGQFLQTGDAAGVSQADQEIADALAHEGLAAGNAQPLNAAGDEEQRQALHFLEAQEVAARQEGRVLAHAIGAAQVATVGHRQADIGQSPAEAIDQRWEPRRGHKSVHEAKLMPSPGRHKVRPESTINS